MKGLIYNRAPASSLGNSFLQIEFREWGLLATAIIITLLLTAGIISFAVPAFHASSQHPDLPSNQILRSLIGLVLLFDFYSIYQHLSATSNSKDAAAALDARRAIPPDRRKRSR